MGLLFYAPWAYGSTRPGLVDFLDMGLGLCFLFHVAGLVAERRMPRYPLLPSACLVVLVLQAGWLWFNARSFVDDTFGEFVPLIPAFPGLPGSWDKEATFRAWKTLSAMSGAFLVASDMVANDAWRHRLWRVLAIAGFSVIIYGLVIKGMGKDSLLSMFQGRDVDPTFFGPFRYHGNAGSYLNFIWPVILALLLRSWRKGSDHAGVALWSGGLVLAFSACFVNTSKAAAAIACAMLVLAVLIFVPLLQRQLVRSRWISRVLVGGFILGIVAILVYGGITQPLQTRWQTLIDSGKEMDAGSRLLVDQTCLRMIPDAGWWGMGPGTFVQVFPFYTNYLGDALVGYWIYAHNDYLQTVVEYGKAGTVLWAMLFFGGQFRAFRQGWRRDLRTFERILFLSTFLALSGVALHSLVDFPLQIASLQLYVMVFLAYAWRKTGVADAGLKPRHERR